MEIDRLCRYSSKLQEQIDTFDGNLSALEMNTSASIRYLSELDGIKHRMSSCAAGLQQAQSLTRTLGDIDDVFGSKSPIEVCFVILTSP